MSVADKQLFIVIRRNPTDWRRGTVEFSKIENLRWSTVSGGVKVSSFQPFIYGYAWCTDIDEDIAHSGIHGECPHQIKVCVVRKDNASDVYKKLLEIVGPKPK